MKIHILKNQSFCNGVTRALKIAEEASKNKALTRPIYLLGNLIHNTHINSYIASLGIIQLEGTSRLQMLQSIDEGTVIFTAHGVSDKVKKQAISQGLNIIDATCPVVRKSEELIKEYSKKGYTILFIGKKTHPESLTVIDDINDSYIIDPLNPIIPDDLTNVAVAHQTTMSGYDINHIYDIIKEKYPDSVKLPVLCNITEKRQKELIDLDINVDKPLIIVIGDKLSNNSTKLYEQAERKAPALFISDKDELDLDYIKNFENIFIASGTSTPQYVIDEIINVLKKL